MRRRLRGLLGISDAPNGDVLMLAPCRSVHTVGMRFAIDVAAVDAEGRVCKVQRNLSPGVLYWGHRRACCILERVSDPAAPWFETGARLTLRLEGKDAWVR